MRFEDFTAVKMLLVFYIMKKNQQVHIPNSDLILKLFYDIL